MWLETIPARPFFSIEMVLAALRAGVRGYVLKNRKTKGSRAPFEPLAAVKAIFCPAIIDTIPGGAPNVGILIQNYTGITGWQTICARLYTQARSVIIIVSGTTLSPSCSGG